MNGSPAQCDDSLPDVTALLPGVPAELSAGERAIGGTTSDVYLEKYALSRRFRANLTDIDE
jgi:hypothetical protein